MSKFRNWVFTLNNYTDDEHTAILNVEAHCPHIKYLVGGLEVGETGTPHIQGLIVFDTPFPLNRIKRIPGFERIHAERMKGTTEQADKYCRKDGLFFTIGEKPTTKPGKRNDLVRVRETADNGGMFMVARDALTLHELKFAEQYLTYAEPARDWKPTVYWYYGKTGLGKSRKARHLLSTQFGEERVYVKSDGTKWWPGYDAHGAVILDDFRDSWCSVTEILSLLDRYEKRVEFKGGYRQFKPKVIVVTSCSSPREMYSNTGEAIDQLLRRIDHVEQFIFEWTPPEVCVEITPDVAMITTPSTVQNISRRPTLIPTYEFDSEWRWDSQPYPPPLPLRQILQQRRDQFGDVCPDSPIPGQFDHDIEPLIL